MAHAIYESSLLGVNNTVHNNNNDEMIEQLNIITSNHTHNLFILNIIVSLAVELKSLANTLPAEFLTTDCYSGQSTFTSVAKEQQRLLELADTLSSYITQEGMKLIESSSRLTEYAFDIASEMTLQKYLISKMFDYANTSITKSDPPLDISYILLTEQSTTQLTSNIDSLYEKSTYLIGIFNTSGAVVKRFFIRFLKKYNSTEALTLTNILDMNISQLFNTSSTDTVTVTARSNESDKWNIADNNDDDDDHNNIQSISQQQSQEQCRVTLMALLTDAESIYFTMNPSVAVSSLPAVSVKNETSTLQTRENVDDDISQPSIDEMNDETVGHQDGSYLQTLEGGTEHRSVTSMDYSNTNSVMTPKLNVLTHSYANHNLAYGYSPLSSTQSNKPRLDRNSLPQPLTLTDPTGSTGTGYQLTSRSDFSLLRSQLSSSPRTQNTLLLLKQKMTRIKDIISSTNQSIVNASLVIEKDAMNNSINASTLHAQNQSLSQVTTTATAATATTTTTNLTTQSDNNNNNNSIEGEGGDRRTLSTSLSVTDKLLSHSSPLSLSLKPRARARATAAEDYNHKEEEDEEDDISYKTEDMLTVDQIIRDMMNNHINDIVPVSRPNSNKQKSIYFNNNNNNKSQVEHIITFDSIYYNNNMPVTTTAIPCYTYQDFKTQSIDLKQRATLCLAELLSALLSRACNHTLLVTRTVSWMDFCYILRYCRCTLMSVFIFNIDGVRFYYVLYCCYIILITLHYNYLFSMTLHHVCLLYFI